MRFEDEDPARRNSLPYPMDVGSPKFELVPVKSQKDHMLNIARLSAQQEYDRIMELVNVLRKQADQIKKRLDLTDMIYDAYYEFQVVHGQTYWLIYHKRTQRNILSINGPKSWISGPPFDYEYICAVKSLGDHTWIEVESEKV